MEFYIASALQNAKQVKSAAEKLKSLGHVHSYDWTTHGDVRSQGEKKLANVAMLESEAVIKSELVLVLLPGMRGTHTELGIAIASSTQKQIWVWSETGEHFQNDENTCAFYFHPKVTRFVGAFSVVLDNLK